ncbi:MAG: sugar phosphate isomerase/epimerase [Planctomycetes bacterium]|nr:sugar phosphate isomerase/epimerase [Planctomycetota bacterium]
MSDIQIGINLEFVRSSDKSFRFGIRKAAELGYSYVEPCVATGYDLLAVAGYYHMLSMEDDPHEMLEAIADRVAHVHAKDIDMRQSRSERGKITGTPVGCASGDGVVDWPRVVRIPRKHGYRGVLSVECGTIEQAERSIRHLRSVLER